MDPTPDSTPPIVHDPENPAVRRYIRKPIAAKVTGKAEAGFGHLFFDSQDLSIGGAFLRADLLLEVGEELSLELHLPGWRGLDAKARVAWVRRSEGSGGMGIEFIDLPDKDKELLSRFLESA
jgi:hypothetical protein